LTGRERVIAALNFKQPDKVPIDFNGHRSSGISVTAYRELRKFLDLPPSNLYVYDLIQQLAIVENDVLDLFDIDTFQLGCDFDKYPEYWRDWVLEDGTACKIPASANVKKTSDGAFIYNKNGLVLGKQPPGCLYFEQTNFPLLDCEDKEDFSDYDSIQSEIMWADVNCPPMPINYNSAEGAKKLREIAATTRNSTDRAIYGIFGGSIVETGQFAFRMDNFLMNLLVEPELIHDFLDATVERHMSRLEAYLDAVGDYIDIIGFSDDMGTQGGPQFSPETYMDFFFNRHKQMWSYIHDRYPDMKICLHCCGGVRPLMPLLVDAGLDAINPVQFVCKGMALADLKAEFHGKLTLWGGGCDTRDTLPGDDLNKIAPHVKANIETLNKGGGFVFQAVHNILANVPPANIAEMFKAARQ